jgi:hypothetical protein
MCNAFNHPRYCLCGWGADGLMGYANSYDRKLEKEFIELANGTMNRNLSNKLMPNYQCKCCGQKVYFFQSSNGGKVLFEALGKPWPKHECLVMTYLKKRESLKISSDAWHLVSELITTPSSDKFFSFFTGVAHDGADLNLLKFRMSHKDPLLIKDIYLDAKSKQKINQELEALVILDDGTYDFATCILEVVNKFELRKVESKKNFKNQSQLF